MKIKYEIIYVYANSSEEIVSLFTLLNQTLLIRQIIYSLRKNTIILNVQEIDWIIFLLTKNSFHPRLFWLLFFTQIYYVQIFRCTKCRLFKNQYNTKCWLFHIYFKLSIIWSRVIIFRWNSQKMEPIPRCVILTLLTTFLSLFSCKDMVFYICCFQ